MGFQQINPNVSLRQAVFLRPNCCLNSSKGDESLASLIFPSHMLLEMVKGKRGAVAIANWEPAT